MTPLEVAEAAYRALLRAHSYRHTNQRELCMLRDFIAELTGRDEQDVQDDFEAQVTLGFTNVSVREHSA